MGLGRHRCGREPDIVMAAAGDADLEMLAAVSILRRHLPELKIRVINVDLMSSSPRASPHGRRRRIDLLFTKDADHLAYHCG